jgi:hypothetical protein
LNELPNVVILIARCSRSKQSFGIRLEKKVEKADDLWIADWAFAIKEKAIEREGYDQSEVDGTFGFDPAYPGCPYCHAPSVFQCVCGKVACWDGESRIATCPWCGSTVELREPIESLTVGRDL